MNISFQKVDVVPSTGLTPGRVYFESSTGLVKVANSATTVSVYGGVRSASYDETTHILTLVDESGDTITANLEYNLATTTSEGLMSAADKAKLDGIEEGANNYALPTASSTTLGGIKVGTNLAIANGVLSAKDTTYSVATTTANGLMSSADKIALDSASSDIANIQTDISDIQSQIDGIVSEGGEPNVIETVQVNGSALTVTNKTVNIPAASTTVAGVMTASDKTKLNGIATGANNYSLPTASASTLGGVKVGSGLSITNGVLSATGGGTADAVEWSNVLNKPDFAGVATSGNYDDLSNKPVHFIELPLPNSITINTTTISMDIINEVLNNPNDLFINTNARSAPMEIYIYEDYILFIFLVIGTPIIGTYFSMTYLVSVGTGVITNIFQNTIKSSTVLDPTQTPLMDGTAAIGTSESYAREDHVHPTDSKITTLESYFTTDVNYSAPNNILYYPENMPNQIIPSFTGYRTIDDYGHVSGTLGPGITIVTAAKKILVDPDSGNDEPYAAQTVNPLTITLNNGTTEGTDKFTFDGTAAKTVNIDSGAVTLEAIKSV